MVFLIGENRLSPLTALAVPIALHGMSQQSTNLVTGDAALCWAAHEDRFCSSTSTCALLLLYWVAASPWAPSIASLGLPLFPRAEPWILSV